MLCRLAIIVVVAALAGRIARADEVRALTSAEVEKLFAEKIEPLIAAKCLSCHGNGKKLEGKLDLRSRAGALKGGDSGQPAISPGNPGKSLLLLAVSRRDRELKMPPKENDRLNRDEVAQIERWIAAGAPWPAKKSGAWDAAGGVTVATSGGRTSEWTNRKYKKADLWAWQPIGKPSIPSMSGDLGNPIDAFIRDKLHAAGFRPALQADKLTLIRRLTFDLTGLPPTPDEIADFELRIAEWRKKEKSEIRIPQAAIIEIVDRLLASPRYGEQQARHWFDVTRYADTAGFSNDFERPNAWRYRDYVVRSFNQDKPFDRFILEQLAGDELDPRNPENLIAVGFLRLGPWEHTAMTVAAVTRQQFLDDVTHHVGVTFLGQGLRCASCHDHKFDPVPTKDYYRMQAVFAATQFAERSAPFVPQEHIGGFAEARAMVQERLDAVKTQQAALKKKSDDAMAQLLRDRGVTSIEKLPAQDRPKKDYLGPVVGLNKTDLTLRKVLQKSEAYLQRELQRFEPLAFSVYSGPPNQYTSVRLKNPVPKKRAGPAPAVHVLQGGSLESPAEEAAPGVLSAMQWTADDADRARSIPVATEGRRLALARWIASPKNTLTARVIVNRVWQQHFGKGLVATPNNFGKMGARPMHPELLDWLAAWFIEHGWSIKSLHRLIVTSATYRQSGTHPQVEQLQRKDSRNDLLAYYPPRRMSAEELRDAMLAASGELNREMGGPGVFPEIHWDVAMQPRHIMGSVAPAYLPSPTPRQRNRRTLYAFRYRTLPDPMLEAFNRPNSEASCERRDATTVAPQALALFNSAGVHSRALAFAIDLARYSPTLGGRIELAFRRVYGRNPSAEENRACTEHVQKMIAHHRRTPPVRTELPRVICRSMVEELTGETVTWEEDLSLLNKYQRDVQAGEVGAEARALAELCLVLLNSNEFLYVR